MSTKPVAKKQDEGKVDSDQPMRQKQNLVDDAKEGQHETSRTTTTTSRTSSREDGGSNFAETREQYRDEDDDDMREQRREDGHLGEIRDHRRSQNVLDVDDFANPDDPRMPVLNLTESDPKRYEEVRRTMHFTPTTLQQVGHDLRMGDLPAGKTTHSTRVITIADHERVIVTKTVTKIKGEEVAVHTRQIAHDLEHKPINLGVTPNLMRFEGNLSDKLRVKSTPLQPLDVLLRDAPDVYLANPHLRTPDMNLILNHIDPNFDLHLKPIETKMKINYDMEEEASVKAIKVVKPVDIEQRILKKTTKEVRSIPTIVERKDVCDGNKEHASYKMTSSRTVNGKTETRTESGELGDEGTGELNDESTGDFIKSALQASSFSEQAAKEAQDIKSKGLSIVETLKRQAEELRQAALATNKGIDELDEARQAEVHARLNSHRLQIEKELEARIAEEQELIFRVKSNADKLKAAVRDQIKAEYARIEGSIKGLMQGEDTELAGLRDRFFGLERDNLAKIEPWAKQRMDELTRSLADCQKQLDNSRVQCEKVIADRFNAIDAEAKDRMEKISAKLKDEIGQLRSCKDMIEKEEVEMFKKRRAADEDRMRKELEGQTAVEKRYIVDCRSQVEAEVAAKIKEIIEIAKLRKSELDKQVEREKAMIDQFCDENIRGLENDKQNALESSKRREEMLKNKYHNVSDGINTAWEPSLKELNSRLNDLRQETARREKELADALDRENNAIKALRDQRNNELKKLSESLGKDAKARKDALDASAKQLMDAINNTKANATADCQRRIKDVENVHGGAGKSLAQRHKAFMDALNAEKAAHEEELMRLADAAEKRAKDLSMDISICKERLLDNSKDYEAELKHCQAVVAEKEKALARLRAIEEERKRAVLATEAAFSNMRMELELTRQALGSLRLASEDIEANTHQYAIESKGSRAEQVSESSASATASKSFAVETSIDAGGKVHKNVSESETKIVRNK